MLLKFHLNFRRKVKNELIHKAVTIEKNAIGELEIFINFTKLKFWKNTLKYWKKIRAEEILCKHMRYFKTKVSRDSEGSQVDHSKLVDRKIKWNKSQNFKNIEMKKMRAFTWKVYSEGSVHIQKGSAQKTKRKKILAGRKSE